MTYDFGDFKVQPKTLTNYTAPPADDPATGNSSLTVLTYNDVQTAAADPEKMGRLVGAVNTRETAIENPTVVIGGGDQVSPSSLSPVSNWTVPVDTLNVLDPSAEVIGNHDLDYGFDEVENFSEASEFPWLLANVKTADGENVPGTQDYTIVERGDVRIGVIGLVDEAIDPKTAVDFDEEGYEIQDFNEVGSSLATELKTEENVDVVIAAAHIGVPESEELAQNTENIDLIVTGDDEVAYQPQTVDGTVIVEAEARANYLGEVNLSVTSSEVSMTDGRLIELEDSDFPINQTANATVADARGEYLSETVGETTVPLDSRFDSNYAEDTIWGNVITDAFVAETGGDVAITNAGGIRGDFVIEPGTVTYDDVYTSLPFGNHLVVKKMTGEQLSELLASQVTSLDANYGAQAQLQVSGVTYEFVGAPDADTQVTDLYVNGEPINMDATYNVTLNSYMAGWTFGDRYGWNMSDLPTVTTDYTLYGTATADYVEAISPIDRTGQDRIRRVTRTTSTAEMIPSGSTTTVTVTLPDTVQSLNTSTVHIHNETGATLTADSATIQDDQLSAEFDAATLEGFATASDTLELYAAYTDSDYVDSRSGFDSSVLNADVPVEAATVSPVVRIGADPDIPVSLASGTAVPVTVANATAGIGAYELTIAVEDPSTAQIAEFTPRESTELQNVSIADDGSQVTVEAALVNATESTSVTLGTLHLDGIALGSETQVTIPSLEGPFSINGSAYADVTTRTGSLTVTPGDVTGNDQTMTDPDGDGQYEDVNGDGQVNIVDAQALFAARNDAATTASTTAFDLNNDGDVNVGDVQHLFATLTA